MTAFTDWLDARDGEALARAWGALDIVRVEVGEPDWRISMHGAAQFAAAFLGWPIERLAWLGNTTESMPAPTFHVERETSRCFLEDRVDDTSCYEYWSIREDREGERGVQYVSVSSRIYDGTYDGKGTQGSVVRVFDRATSTGAAIFAHSQTVATIGTIDLGAIDLFTHDRLFGLPTWTQYDFDSVCGLVAQLASEIDAHFDVSASWPARTVEEQEGHAILLSLMRAPEKPNMFMKTVRYESGPYAIQLRETRHRNPGIPDEDYVIATVHGLPWGYDLETRLDRSTRGITGSVRLRLPLALGKAVITRLSRVVMGQ